MLICDTASQLYWAFAGNKAVKVILIDPLVEVVEAVWISYIKYQDAAVGSTVVASGKRAKSFLAGRVP